MTTRINEHYTMTKQTFHRQLMFDLAVPGCFRPLTRQEIQKARLPKPEPVDVFRNDPQEKLWKIAGLQDADRYLGLALDAIRYFFFGNKDDDNTFIEGNLYRYRYVDTFEDGHHIHYEVGKWLFERESWSGLLETEPLHICFDEFVRPLRDHIAELFQQIENKKIGVCY
nr:MAG TPA: hypothetical protein [Herelleviridae sp.]